MFVASGDLVFVDPSSGGCESASSISGPSSVTTASVVWNQSEEVSFSEEVPLLVEFSRSVRESMCCIVRDKTTMPITMATTAVKATGKNQTLELTKIKEGW
ncbi:hypothetical protein HPB48_002482 [Haemaphysalis longicornis]|uniref:Uncharacterized protein n=1 Tax=Haemaphysalis longicornis TaxID=44386 RepID=A0A9J6G628_HAELO|nr:hypothetical protein HPB48_002482 [Haemaphysalis longicornis]